MKDKDVRKVILNPDFLEETVKGRKNAWKRFGSGFLRVTFKREEDIIHTGDSPYSTTPLRCVRK
ncbi:MAG: hypothetical protein ACE5IH_07845 [Thermodesulfobacteriota bacterium]